MNPIAVLILEYGLKYGPDAMVLARKILTKKDPTDADYAELETILEKTGRSYFKEPVSA